MEDIERGRLVWLKNVIDTRGKPTHPHCAVILTTNADFNAGKPIKAAIISSKFDGKSADRIVKLRHMRGGHPQTGLDRPSAVICDWILDIDEDDITRFGNILYGSVLIDVLTKASTQS